jgi:hypothetical protein
LIDVKRVNATNVETFEALDLSTNTVVTHAPKGGKEDINRAIEAGHENC